MEQNELTKQQDNKDNSAPDIRAISPVLGRSTMDYTIQWWSGAQYKQAMAVRSEAASKLCTYFGALLDVADGLMADATAPASLDRKLYRGQLKYYIRNAKERIEKIKWRIKDAVTCDRGFVFDIYDLFRNNMTRQVELLTLAIRNAMLREGMTDVTRWARFETVTLVLVALQRDYDMICWDADVQAGVPMDQYSRLAFGRFNPNPVAQWWDKAIEVLLPYPTPSAREAVREDESVQRGVEAIVNKVYSRESIRKVSVEVAQMYPELMDGIEPDVEYTEPTVEDLKQALGAR